MSVSAVDIWKLLNQSQLVKPEQCQKLQAEYQRVKGANEDAKFLAQWLVARKSITRYQAGVLLAGRPGPFFYGQYKVIDRLRDGKLKTVFRAYHLTTGHPVMLQFVTGDQAQDADRWHELAGAVAERTDVTQPSLQRIYEAVDLTSFKFIVQEDLRGETLADRVASQGRLKDAEASRVFRGVAQALDALHQAGIMHGQIRPDNIWLEESGAVRLLHDPTGAGGAIPETCPYTPADFAAPELVQSGSTCLTDVYALGCSLYFALSGQVPFPGGGDTEKIARHASEAVSPLTQFGVSESLAKVVSYLLAKPVEVRFPTAEIVIDQLGLYVDNSQLVTPPAPPTLELFEEAINQKQQQLAAVGHPAATSSAPAVQIDAGESSPRAQTGGRRRKRPGTPWMTIVVSLSLLLIAGIGGYAVWKNGKKNTGDNGQGPDSNQVSHGGNKGTKQEVVRNNPNVPWATPTSGTAVEYSFAPEGCQAFISARLADIEASPEGERVLRAIRSSFGPKFAKMVGDWSNAAGVASTEVERLIVCLVPDEESEVPGVCFVVRLKEAKKKEDLLTGWKSPGEAEEQGKKYYKGPKWSYFIPVVGEGKIFVMGAEEHIKDVISLGGKPPVLRREMERLRTVSDSNMHVSILFTPNFFFGDGQVLFAGFRENVRKSLEWFLGDGLKAVSFSMHFDKQFFAEMRFFGAIDKDAHMISTEVKQRIDQLPDLTENYVAALNVHPYWKRVAIRLPRMVNFLQQHVRIGVEDKQAVVNMALPQNAAHNLVFAVGMVAISEPGKLIAANNQPNTPNSMAEVLAKKMNLAFDQTSLEFAMRDLGVEVRDTFSTLPFRFDIKIIGDDLKLDGITRNQQIRNFNLQDKSLADILTALVMKANPVTTVKEPSEKDQKLIWVVAKDPQAGGDIVLITTRAAAAKKNYKLPAVFQLKE